MDAVLEQVKDLFNIEHIDIEKEENQDMVDDYRIMSVPTMIIFDEENRKIERITGTCTVEKLKEYA
jgi:thioredoxin-related protein